MTDHDTEAQSIASAIMASHDARAAHNTRALLLRLADGDPWDDLGSAEEMTALARADGLGLVDIDVRLTSLGRDVVEWLEITDPRPEPWWTCDSELFSARTTTSSDGPRAAEFASVALAEQCAVLLNAAERAVAKAYERGDA